MAFLDIKSAFKTISPLLVFFAPVIIPRIIGYYRSFRAPVNQRPSPRPLPRAAARSLNVLFFAILLFLVLSLPFRPNAPAANIYAQTNSRLITPVDVVFTRLAKLRPNNALAEQDTLLRAKLASLAGRKIYLLYGPDGLISCQFCTMDHMLSYLLYYLPFNTLLPHLFHLLVVGLATSKPLAGKEPARWRNMFTLAALALAVVDIYLMSTYDPLQMASAAVKAGRIPPASLYHQMRIFRPLTLLVFDCICSLLIYVSATHRFFFTPPTPAEQADAAVSSGISALSGASSKLLAFNVLRGAVVRDKTLKARDDSYWSTAAVVENLGTNPAEPAQVVGSGSIWEEEEVVRAISRAMNGQARNGGLDIAKLGSTAGEYVDTVTTGLELAETPQ